MTFHIAFALAKNVQIILQKRERRVPNQARGWADVDATFHVAQNVQQRSPCLKYESKQRIWKERQGTGQICKGEAANESVTWGSMVS